MGARNHNKRRNSGLLWEFIVRRMSAALVEGDKRAQAAALRLLKRHFAQGTELHRELRIARALMKTSGVTPATASSILGEAKAAARGLDHVRLDKEKGELLRAIARSFHDDSFFEAPVEDYRAYATVQTLFNEWRDPAHADLGRLARYEDELARRLSAAAAPAGERFLNDESPGVNRLAAHIMTRRLNERYSSQLDPAQRDLLRAYAFRSAGGFDPAALTRRLEEARAVALASLDRMGLDRAGQDLVVLHEQIGAARRAVVAEDLTKVDDALLARALSWLRLRSEVDGTAVSLVEGAAPSGAQAGPRLLVSAPEFVARTPALVKESREQNDGFIVVSGILQKADTLNQNGRVYPRAILEREVRNYQKFINEHRATGELDHPDSSVVSYKNVSHRVLEAAMDHDGVVRGRVMILNTPSGKILQDLLEGDVQLGISSRGVGSTQKQGDYVVVQDDFQLICWDFVSEPSTPGAFMLPEGARSPWIAEGRLLTRVERIDRLLAELLVR